MAGLTDSLNHLVGPKHSLPPMGLGLGHGGQATCSLTELTRTPGPSPVDLANGPLVPDFWVVGVPGPFVLGPPTWPFFAPGLPPRALFAHDPGQVQEWETVWFPTLLGPLLGLYEEGGCQQLTWPSLSPFTSDGHSEKQDRIPTQP